MLGAQGPAKASMATRMVSAAIMFVVIFVGQWIGLQMQGEKDHCGFHKKPTGILFTGELAVHIFFIFSEHGLLKVWEQGDHVGFPIATRLD